MPTPFRGVLTSDGVAYPGAHDDGPGRRYPAAARGASGRPARAGRAGASGGAHRQGRGEAPDAPRGVGVGVVGGGCSGFQYPLDFTNEARSNDFVYQVEDLTVYVDAVSARYLEGTRIDYVMGTAGAGFKFHNPRPVGSCGCGSSFAG